MKKVSKNEILEVLKDPEHVEPTSEGAPDFSEIQEKIKTGEMRVEFAPSLHIDDLEPYVDQVLEAIGFGSAWVSDMSKISDFPLSPISLGNARKELGIDFDGSDYIYQVAQRLKDKE